MPTPTKGGDLRVIRRKAKNTIRDLQKVASVLSEPLSLKRKVGVYPPQVRESLAKFGNEPISSLTVCRAPIQSFVRSLLNVLSLGSYDKAVKDSHYDNMMHLSLSINGRYLLDKQAVVKLQQATPASNAETMDVPLGGKSFTISELVDNTKAFLGPKAFSNYDARTNNCQIFIDSVLQANGILTDDLHTFIKQDADTVFQKMPSITQKLASVVTDIGATADRLIEGEGKKKSASKANMPGKKPDTPWILHVKATMAQNKGMLLKDILKKASQTYKK